MKSILACLAILAMSANAIAEGEKGGFEKAMDKLKSDGQTLSESHNELSEPVRYVIGTVTLPTGTVVEYVAEAAAGLDRDLIETNIANVYNSGTCLEGAVGQQPGVAVSCLIQLPGDIAISTVAAPGNQLATLSDYTGKGLTRVLGMSTTAVKSLEKFLEEKTGLPPCVDGLRVISFTLDATGQVVGETFRVVTGTIGGTTQGLVLVGSNVIDFPVSLLRGEFRRSLGSVAIAGVGVVCTATDLLLAPAHLAIGLYKLVGKRNPRVWSCYSELMKATK
jgi:hypothetical protein